MDKDIIKVRLCPRTVRAEQLCHQSVKHIRSVGSLLVHNQPLPEHAARSTNRCKRDIACSHKQLVIITNQIQWTVHITTHHTVLRSILYRDRILRWYGGCFRPITSLHNTVVKSLINFRGVDRWPLSWNVTNWWKPIPENLAIQWEMGRDPNGNQWSNPIATKMTETGWYLGQGDKPEED